jgi:hypothetical protein
MLAEPLATMCKVVFFHHLGMLTFNNLLNHLIKVYKNKTKFPIVPTFLVGGLIEDYN